jgi:hypothetical protein
MKADQITASLGPLLNWGCVRGVHVWSEKGLPLFFFSDNRVTITAQGIRYRKGCAAYTIIGWCTVHGVEFVLRNPAEVELLRRQSGLNAQSNVSMANEKGAIGEAKRAAETDPAEPAKAALSENVVELFPTRK